MVTITVNKNGKKSILGRTTNSKSRDIKYGTYQWIVTSLVLLEKKWVTKEKAVRGNIRNTERVWSTLNSWEERQKSILCVFEVFWQLECQTQKILLERLIWQ